MEWSMYHPDKWTIVDYGEKFKEDRYAIMAGWGGSFVYGASWKRSSPILSVVECEGGWIASTLSGSQYLLHKKRHGVTSQTAMIICNNSLVEVENVVELLKGWKVNNP